MSELGDIQNRLIRAGIEHDPDGLLTEASRPGMRIVAMRPDTFMMWTDGGGVVGDSFRRAYVARGKSPSPIRSASPTVFVAAMIRARGNAPC